jgi:hypothetical protein
MANDIVREHVNPLELFLDAKLHQRKKIEKYIWSTDILRAMLPEKVIQKENNRLKHRIRRMLAKLKS